MSIKIYCFLLITIFVASLYAQEKNEIATKINIDSKLEKDGRDSGGGSHLEILNEGSSLTLLRVRQELVNFLSGQVGQKLYDHIDLSSTIQILKDDSKFKVVNSTLKDKYDIPRDAINIPSIGLIKLKTNTFNEVLNSKSIFVLILHEVFGLLDIEQNNPNDLNNSYIESIKIWNYIGIMNVYTLSGNSNRKCLDLEFDGEFGGESYHSFETVCADINPLQTKNGYQITNFSPSILASVEMSKLKDSFRRKKKVEGKICDIFTDLIKYKSSSIRKKDFVSALDIVGSAAGSTVVQSRVTKAFSMEWVPRKIKIMTKVNCIHK